MSRKPPARTRSRTMIENLHQLDVLDENPRSLDQFILDTLVVADKTIQTEIPDHKALIRQRMMAIFRQETRVDIKSMIMNQQMGHMAAEENEKHIRKFEEQVERRSSMLTREFALLVVNIALIDRSREAIKDIFANKKTAPSAEVLEDVNHIYSLTLTLVQKLIDAYCNKSGTPRKKNRQVRIDLNDLDTLVEWLQEFISHYLQTSQELYGHVYDAEEKAMAKYEDHLPKLIRELLALWEKAKEIFAAWASRSKPPALPSVKVFYDSLERDSWRIAWDRIEHLHKALVRTLGELCQHPELPLANNINQLASWYTDLKKSEQQPTSTK